MSPKNGRNNSDNENYYNEEEEEEEVVPQKNNVEARFSNSMPLSRHLLNWVASNEVQSVVSGS